MTNRELDAAIAEKIFGEPMPSHQAEEYLVLGMWRAVDIYGEPDYKRETREFSTDPAASKQLEDRLITLGWNIILRRSLIFGCTADVYCNYSPCERHGHIGDTYHGAEVNSETTMLALSLAALKAVGVEAAVSGKLPEGETTS